MLRGTNVTTCAKRVGHVQLNFKRLVSKKFQRVFFQKLVFKKKVKNANTPWATLGAFKPKRLKDIECKKGLKGCP